MLRTIKITKPKEKDICKEFVKLFEFLNFHKQFKNQDGTPKPMFMFHIANEQHTTKAYTLSLKAMGLKAGVADYCFLLPGGRVAFIEFKRDKRCYLSAAQKEFSLICETLNIPYMVAYSVDDAISWIRQL